MHTRWGVPGVEDKIGMAPIGQFCSDVDAALDGLLALASAHETKDASGRYREYVEACKAGSNRAPQRTARIRNISAALRGGI